MPWSPLGWLRRNLSSCGPQNSEGEFKQVVTVYCSTDRKIFKRTNVVIDTGNEGPSLVTDEVMRHVHGVPKGLPGIVTVFNGEAMEVGREVELEFSGGENDRLFKETFRHVPYIPGGYGMNLSHDFYLKWCPGRVPPVLMIRNGRETKEQKRRRKEREQIRELEREELARQQEEERQAYHQELEEIRYVRKTKRNSSRDSSTVRDSSSGSVDYHTG
ncbi:hypothetical protein HYALB_00007537 [Hymenoscyphus albidus]|uniref:Uncharacterized protein n=1 Tax=Hymenoscyphus albidus TaxID=595503 RepID=A0A9N9LIB7_9HELO|nr:hypothetical protein HYALB_00007537 [Hymenoscyphus albidus]